MTPDNKGDKPKGKVTEEQKERQRAESHAKALEDAKTLVRWYRMGLGLAVKEDATPMEYMAEAHRIKQACKGHSTIELGERITCAMAEFVSLPVPDHMSTAYMLGVLNNLQSTIHAGQSIMMEKIMGDVKKQAERNPLGILGILLSMADPTPDGNAFHVPHTHAHHYHDTNGLDGLMAMFAQGRRRETPDDVEKAMKERQREQEAHEPQTERTAFQRLGGDAMRMDDSGTMVCRQCGQAGSLNMVSNKIVCTRCNL